MTSAAGSNPDFATVGQEVTYFLTHIARAFMGGYSGSGENGIDVSMPTGTPIYAVQGGKVVGAGYYGGGGVVSIQSAPGKVWYYQHLDQNSMQAGQTVQAGELVGYSGGQNTGGNHPALPQYSSFQHIEIGVNAPWSGIWGGGEGPNINPVPDLSQVGSQNANVATQNVGPESTGIASASSSSSSSATGTGGFSLTDPSTWVPGILQGFLSSFGLNSFQDLLWRAGFIIVGIILVIVGIQMMVIKEEAALAGTFTGAAVKAGSAGAG